MDNYIKQNLKRDTAQYNSDKTKQMPVDDLCRPFL